MLAINQRVHSWPYVAKYGAIGASGASNARRETLNACWSNDSVRHSDNQNKALRFLVGTHGTCRRSNALTPPELDLSQIGNSLLISTWACGSEVPEVVVGSFIKASGAVPKGEVSASIAPSVDVPSNDTRLSFERVDGDFAPVARDVWGTISYGKEFNKLEDLVGIIFSISTRDRVHAAALRDFVDLSRVIESFAHADNACVLAQPGIEHAAADLLFDRNAIESSRIVSTEYLKGGQVHLRLCLIRERMRCSRAGEYSNSKNSPVAPHCLEPPDCLLTRKTITP